MSLSRTFFNEFRPFFTLFDDVARSTRSPYSFPTMYRHFAPFDDFIQSRHPTLDLSERDNDYIVEAEVPGVKKENLEVIVGDNGHSLTIEGKVLARAYKNGGNGAAAAATATEGKTAASANGKGDTSTSNEVTKPDSSTPTAITSERDSDSSSHVYASHFTRTVWLPRAVDTSKINATLQDGILTLRIPKITENQGSVKVQIQ